jgi:hypothetical protein
MSSCSTTPNLLHPIKSETVPEPIHLFSLINGHYSILPRPITDNATVSSQGSGRRRVTRTSRCFTAFHFFQKDVAEAVGTIRQE